MRQGKQDGNRGTAYPERPADSCRSEYPGQQQTGREREHQPQEPTREIVACQRPAHAEMAETGKVPDGEYCKPCPGSTGKDREPSCGQFPDEQRIKYVADVFEKQGPARSVQGIHFIVSPDIHCSAGYGRNQEQVESQSQQYKAERDLGPIPFPAALDAERYGAEQRTHYYHGMQPDEPSLEETADSEGLLPSVIVCVAYHES